MARSLLSEGAEVRILALLLAACPMCWTWDRLTVDCHGNPETVSYYYFQATMRQIVNSSCFDDQGQPYPCLVTLPADPIRFGPNIPDPGEGASVSTMADPVENPDLLPTPPVGGLAAWPWFTSDNPHPVAAEDDAGNKSGDLCP